MAAACQLTWEVHRLTELTNTAYKIWLQTPNSSIERALGWCSLWHVAYSMRYILLT